MDKIKGIIVEIGGDTTKLGKALDNVNEKTKKLQSELKGVNTLLKMNPGNTTLLKQKQDLLNKSIAETKDKLESLKSTMSKINGGEIKVTEEEYRWLQREIVATENKLKNLNKEARNFGTVFSQQLSVAGNKMIQIGEGISNVGKKFTVVSATASAALVGISKSAIDFESAFTGVTKTVEATDEELEIIKQGILDLSKRTASSATDIAAVAEAAGQLGIKKENILSFTESIVALGDSTNLTAEEAASQLAKFANIMQMSQEDFDKLGSSIVDLGNNFATTEADIVDMAMRLAGAGKQVGLSEGQVLGLATALSSVGIEAEMGGSAISKAMVKMQTAVENGGDNLNKILKKTGMSLRDLELLSSNNSKDFKVLCDSIGMTSTEVKNLITAGTNLEDFAKISGKTTEQFKNDWKNNATGALTDFIKGLGNAEEKGESAITLLTDMGLTEVRLRDSLLRAANAGELFNDAIKTGTEAWEENTALTNEANKRYATTESKIAQLKASITELCVKLGEILLPIIQKICDKIAILIDWISNLNPTTQKILVIIIAIVAAIAPLLIVIGKVVSSIGIVFNGISKLISIVKVIINVLKILFTVIAAHPVIAIIVAIIATVVLLWNKCEWFRNLILGMLETIKNAVINIWNKIKAVWDIVLPYFIALFDGIKNSLKPLIDSISNAFSKAWELIKATWELVKPFFQEVWDGIKTIFSVVSNVLGGKFRIAFEVIKGIWNVAVPFFQEIWRRIKIVFSVVSEVLGSFFRTAWEIIKSVWNVVVSYFSAIFDSIAGIFSAITSVLHGDFSGAWEAIKSVVSRWGDYFKTVFESIKNIFSSVGSFFSDVFKSAYNGIINIFSGIGSFFDGIWNTIKDTFSKVGTTIGDVIGNSFKSVVNAILNFAEKKINGFIRDINSAIGVINNIPGVNIPKLSELNIPKLKVGMANVPYDDYLALLHKGERVLTAKENREYSNKTENRVSENIDNSFNVTINSPEATSPAENARILRREIQRYRMQHA